MNRAFAFASVRCARSPSPDRPCEYPRKANAAIGRNQEIPTTINPRKSRAQEQIEYLLQIMSFLEFSIRTIQSDCEIIARPSAPAPGWLQILVETYRSNGSRICTGGSLEGDSIAKAIASRVLVASCAVGVAITAVSTPSMSPAFVLGVSSLQTIAMRSSVASSRAAETTPSMPPPQI